jgi:predicted phage terminase large subunit-like protein
LTTYKAILTNLRRLRPTGSTDARRWKMYFRYDVEAFARFFLRHYANRTFSDFHRCMLWQYADDHKYRFPFQGRAFPSNLQTRDRAENRTTQRTLFVAPRGNAKTTLASTICATHALCYSLERYITIFSATQTQATQIVQNLRDELRENKRLNDWFSFYWLDEGKAAFTVNGLRVEAHGLKTARRGIKWGNERPTLIILDDVEEDESVLSADQRRKIADRYKRVIEHLGSPHTNLWVCGTVLHREALLMDLMTRPDYRVFFFRALESEPDRTDLWEQWGKLYMDLGDGQREQTANAFYLANKADMDAGAKVLWPELEDLESLQKLRLVLGSYAFNAEKQNDARDPDTQVFFPEGWTRFRIEGTDIVLDGERIPLESTLIFGFLDPALGQDETAATKRGRKSFAAYITIAIDSKGRIFVLDAALTKDPPARQVTMCVDRLALWGGAIAFEDVAFQKLLKEPFMAELKRRDLPVPNVSTLTQPQNKVARIMRLEPMATHGWFFINETISRVFVSQVETFPTGDDLDGPDALEGAVRFAQRKGALRFVA